MSGPRPSSAFVTARRIVRDEAVARTERRLGVSPDVMPAISGIAEEQLRPALGDTDPRQAGWAALAAGTLIAKNGERLASAAGDQPLDHSFLCGLAWAALLVAVVGDTLLGIEEPTRARAWEPTPAALEAQRTARELAIDPPDARSLAAARFVTYAVSEISGGLEQLDARQAGFALLMLAVWIAGNAERITEPLSRRRWLPRRHAIDPEEASAGCAFTATVLADIGESLVSR
ncbi:MAG TPA: hypothetical protein VG223_12085 [Solirubrobacteraceae bacterium]|jgi:hypothetical protein|nr:hypothetical protein [Solirubrobacteraceae bacterium]